MSAARQERTSEPRERPRPPGWRVEPTPGGRGEPPRPAQQSWRRLGWRLVLLALILFGINYWAASRATHKPPRVRIPYSPLFLQEVRSGNVEQITSKGTAIQGEFERPVAYGKARSRRFRTEVPAFANTDALSKLLQEKRVVINAQPLDTGAPWWQTLLFGFGPTLLFLALLFWLFRRAAGGAGGMLGGLGRSRARRYEPTTGRVSFADVAGIDEAKAELTEIVDFLRSPDKYRRLGGRIPRGVLLSGPPGTGKTLLARAVAGEAGAPFFSMSASEFIEMIVGVGASRVRDLFAQAKAAAPAIIFIDELDAIGRSRGPGVGAVGGHDEREQTLNQILTEMDGFDPSTGVIVLAATNRPDVLDPALLRPGRFDRRVSVQPPDRTGRRLILEVHTRSVPLAPDVDLDRIAGSTPGMVGADLANLVNEAALLAARRDHERVAAEDFSDALEKIVLGAERKIMLTPDDRERTAYHEAGHAVVGMLTPGADPVRKVSIIPRGMSLGVTFAAPEADRFSYDEHYLRTKIKVALGGRAADELVFGERTTGAEADIQQLTEIARQMVGRWGMSDAVGPIAVLPQDGRAPFLPGSSEGGERTQELVDQEVRRIVDEAHEEVVELLRRNRDKLDALARALLETETLDEDEAYSIAGVERPPGGDRTPAEAPAGA
jgi:cell division protease FtsH